MHRNGPNDFSAYRDGWWTGSTERTYSNAARWLFPWHSCGYPLAYYPEQDGELVGVVVCADCAAQDWIADPTTTFHGERCEEQLESDCICEKCNTVIAPQQCRLCFDSIHEPPFGHRHDTPLPVFHGDYYVAHGECIAKAITQEPGPYDDPKPVKVGKQAYRVPGASNQIMRGPHAEREETERAIEQFNARPQRMTPAPTGDYVNIFTDEPYMKGAR